MLALQHYAATSANDDDTGATSRDGGEKIKVIVRLRLHEGDTQPQPQVPADEFARAGVDQRSLVLQSKGKEGLTGQQLNFDFDFVAGPGHTQEDLFRIAGRPLVTNLLEGINGALLAYGQTSSGKTYSMFGPSTVKPQELHTTLWPQAGIIPRALKNLFERLPPKYARVVPTSPRVHATAAATPANAARPDVQPPCTPIAPTPHRHGRSLEPSWLVKLSVLEVYQEVVSDLLADPGPVPPTSGGPQGSNTFSGGSVSSSRDGEPLKPAAGQRLQVREDITHGVCVEGLGEHCVDNVEESLALVDRALTTRHVAATRLNGRSSRSHAILLLSLEQRIPEEMASKTPRALDTPMPAHLFPAATPGAFASPLNTAHPPAYDHRLHHHHQQQQLQDCVASSPVQGMTAMQSVTAGGGSPAFASPTSAAKGAGASVQGAAFSFRGLEERVQGSSGFTPEDGGRMSAEGQVKEGDREGPATPNMAGARKRQQQQQQLMESSGSTGASAGNAAPTTPRRIPGTAQEVAYPMVTPCNMGPSAAAAVYTSANSAENYGHHMGADAGGAAATAGLVTPAPKSHAASGAMCIRRSKLYLVDLAGSERQGMGSTSAASAERLKEASTINRSLSALSLVILRLTEGEHVPYRNSKLTHILQCALGGNAYTTLLATINSAATHKLETISTLNFAMRAKRVTVTAFVNEEREGSSVALTNELQRLRNELAAMRASMQAHPERVYSHGSLEAHSNSERSSVQSSFQPSKELRAQQEREQQLRLMLEAAEAASREQQAEAARSQAAHVEQLSMLQDEKAKLEEATKSMQQQIRQLLRDSSKSTAAGQHSAELENGAAHSQDPERVTGKEGDVGEGCGQEMGAFEEIRGLEEEKDVRLRAEQRAIQAEAQCRLLMVQLRDKLQQDLERQSSSRDFRRLTSRLLEERKQMQASLRASLHARRSGSTLNEQGSEPQAATATTERAGSDGAEGHLSSPAFGLQSADGLGSPGPGARADVQQPSLGSSVVMDNDSGAFASGKEDIIESGRGAGKEGDERVEVDGSRELARRRELMKQGSSGKGGSSSRGYSDAGDGKGRGSDGAVALRLARNSKGALAKPDTTSIAAQTEDSFPVGAAIATDADMGPPHGRDGDGGGGDSPAPDNMPGGNGSTIGRQSGVPGSSTDATGHAGNAPRGCRSKRGIPQGFTPDQESSGPATEKGTNLMGKEAIHEELPLLEDLEEALEGAGGEQEAQGAGADRAAGTSHAQNTERRPARVSLLEELLSASLASTPVKASLPRRPSNQCDLPSQSTESHQPQVSTNLHTDSTAHLPQRHFLSKHTRDASSVSGVSLSLPFHPPPFSNLHPQLGGGPSQLPQHSNSASYTANPQPSNHHHYQHDRTMSTLSGVSLSLPFHQALFDGPIPENTCTPQSGRTQHTHDRTMSTLSGVSLSLPFHQPPFDGFHPDGTKPHTTSDPAWHHDHNISNLSGVSLSLPFHSPPFHTLAPGGSRPGSPLSPHHSFSTRVSCNAPPQSIIPTPISSRAHSGTIPESSIPATQNLPTKDSCNAPHLATRPSFPLSDDPSQPRQADSRHSRNESTMSGKSGVSVTLPCPPYDAETVFAAQQRRQLQQQQQQQQQREARKQPQQQQCQQQQSPRRGAARGRGVIANQKTHMGRLVHRMQQQQQQQRRQEQKQSQQKLQQQQQLLQLQSNYTHNSMNASAQPLHRSSIHSAPAHSNNESADRPCMGSPQNEENSPSAERSNSHRGPAPSSRSTAQSRTKVANASSVKSPESAQHGGKIHGVESDPEGRAAEDEGAGAAKNDGDGSAVGETAATQTAAAAPPAAEEAGGGQQHATQRQSQPDTTGQKGASGRNRGPLQRALSPRVAEAHRQIQGGTPRVTATRSRAAASGASVPRPGRVHHGHSSSAAAAAAAAVAAAAQAPGRKHAGGLLAGDGGRKRSRDWSCPDLTAPTLAPFNSGSSTKQSEGDQLPSPIHTYSPEGLPRRQSGSFEGSPYSSLRLRQRHSQQESEALPKGPGFSTHDEDDGVLLRSRHLSSTFKRNQGNKAARVMSSEESPYPSSIPTPMQTPNYAFSTHILSAEPRSTDTGTAAEAKGDGKGGEGREAGVSDSASSSSALDPLFGRDAQAESVRDLVRLLSTGKGLKKASVGVDEAGRDREGKRCEESGEGQADKGIHSHALHFGARQEGEEGRTSGSLGREGLYGKGSEALGQGHEDGVKGSKEPPIGANMRVGGDVDGAGRREGAYRGSSKTSELEDHDEGNTSMAGAAGAPAPAPDAAHSTPPRHRPSLSSPMSVYSRLYSNAAALPDSPPSASSSLQVGNALRSGSGLRQRSGDPSHHAVNTPRSGSSPQVAGGNALQRREGFSRGGFRQPSFGVSPDLASRSGRLQSQLETLRAEMQQREDASNVSDSMLSGELQRRLEMEREAHAQLHALITEALQLVGQVETLMAANEALGQEAASRNEQLAKLEDAMARIHYQLRGMARGVTGGVLAHELGSSRQSALLGSLDLAAPASSSPSAVCRLLEVLSLQHQGAQAYTQTLESTLQVAQAKLVDLEGMEEELQQRQIALYESLGSVGSPVSYSSSPIPSRTPPTPRSPASALAHERLSKQVRSCNVQVEALKQELQLAEEDKDKAEAQLQERQAGSIPQQQAHQSTEEVEQQLQTHMECCRKAEACHEAALQRITELQTALQAEQQRANLLAAQLAAAAAAPAAPAAPATTSTFPNRHPSASQQSAPSRRPPAKPSPSAFPASPNAFGPGALRRSSRGRPGNPNPRAPARGGESPTKSSMQGGVKPFVPTQPQQQRRLAGLTGDPEDQPLNALPQQPSMLLQQTQQQQQQQQQQQHQPDKGHDWDQNDQGHEEGKEQHALQQHPMASSSRHRRCNSRGTWTQRFLLGYNSSSKGGGRYVRMSVARLAAAMRLYRRSRQVLLLRASSKRMSGTFNPIKPARAPFRTGIASVSSSGSLIEGWQWHHEQQQQQQQQQAQRALLVSQQHLLQRQEQEQLGLPQQPFWSRVGSLERGGVPQPL